MRSSGGGGGGGGLGAHNSIYTGYPFIKTLELINNLKSAKQYSHSSYK